jgi:DNA-binding transcriptional MerR regulator
MKPQQLMKLLDIAPTTLRRWSGEEYGEFLSPNGRGVNGAHRAYTEQDARILSWVKVLRAENVPPDDIITTLRSSQASNWRNLPALPGGFAHDEPIAVVPREAVEERVRGLQERANLEIDTLKREMAQIEKERDRLQRRVDTLENENTQLQQQLGELTRQSLETSRRLADLLSTMNEHLKK